MYIFVHIHSKMTLQRNFICICEPTYTSRNIAIRALAWILAYINFVRIFYATHISFLSVAHLYVYTWIDRLVETSNITYRNTEIHPTHILRLVVCVQCSIRVYVWVATRRNIEYRIQKYWTHIRGHFYNRTEETRLSIRRRFIRVLPL